MHKVNTRNMLLILCTFIAFSMTVRAQEKTSKLEGGRPYAPSRLEWLAVELNASLNIRLSKAGYSIDFIPVEKENAIMIYVTYLSNVDRELMNMDIDSVRDIIAIKAKVYGWSSWLKVKERIRLAK